MQNIDRFSTWLNGGPGVNLVSLSLGAAGVLLAFVFYFRGKRVRQPVFRTRTFALIEDKTAKIQSLKILYNDQPVENLSLTRVAIWNRGSEPIRFSDFAETDKLRIKVEDGAKLLGTQIHATNSPTNKFAIIPENENGVININFEYFQKNEGVVINIYHTGKPQTKILPQGTVIGGEQLVQFRQKDLLIDALGKIIFGWIKWFPKTKNTFLIVIFATIFAAYALLWTPVFIPLMIIDKGLAFIRRAPKEFLLE